MGVHASAVPTGFWLMTATGPATAGPVPYRWWNWKSHQPEWCSETDPLPSTNHVSGTVYRRQFATQHYYCVFNWLNNCCGGTYALEVLTNYLTNMAALSAFCCFWDVHSSLLTVFLHCALPVLLWSATPPAQGGSRIRMGGGRKLNAEGAIV